MDFDHANEHIDESMVLIQANLDDMNPEFSSRVSDRLFENGAHDVYYIPIIMKKGRPGTMLNVLTSRERLEQIKTVIFQETTTLGLRYWNAACHRLGRRMVKVNTAWGEVNVKVGIHQGEEVQYAPEFRECEAIAKEHRVPIKQVYDAVRLAYTEQYRKR